MRYNHEEEKNLRREKKLPSSYANLKNIAEKIYKHKKNGIEIALREVLVNATHACIIKKKELENSSDYIPKISINILPNDFSITVEDNGCGFSENDKDIFSEIASINYFKVSHQLPSKGLGRLAIVYFSCKTVFETISDKLKPRKLTFDYPEIQNQLPFFSQRTEETNEESGTKIKITFNKSLYGGFNNKYNELSKFQAWILENFIYLLYDLNDLKMQLTLDNEQIQVKFEDIKKYFFSIHVRQKTYPCEILMVDSDKISLVFIAHKMPVENDKIKYDRQFKSNNKKIYISSELFDEYISLDGLEIKIPSEICEEVEKQICDFLDKEFSHSIEEQKKENCKILKNVQNEFPYLTEFMPDFIKVTGHKPVKKEVYINDAIKEKGEAEKAFWKNEGVMDPRLGKSALYLYVKHRKNILFLLENTLGDEKKSENDFHELLTGRGCINLAEAKHNLWLIDEKFSYFLEGYNSQTGKKEVDIELYFYADSQDKPNNIVLIELKKPRKAHNPGKMIDQIRGYGCDIFKKGRTRNGLNFKAEKCQFYGYIISDIEDIKKEIKSRYDDTFKPIVYTEGSYEGKIFLDDEKKYSFYLTLLSTQDLLQIAKNRNKILFDLLKTPNP
ncbi:hypothetical protein BKH42_03555 [Helicobacter sp. 13S00482-2]|uniref:ATP-binding protein n=1 Tax=Helicobacter sp. 13S00482-2 TaxID=1476200 RepID=UPI000BA6C994|nr:ATP-binding protein [Helicobacter sp. 13S00482-2]PAF53817.1 hypothetical protein BKH42_03555 [Helicobacter sp. 13S00482-2]